MDKLDQSYFKVNENPYIDHSVSSPTVPGQPPSVGTVNPNLETIEAINDMQQDIIGAADVKIINLEEAIFAYANEFAKSHSTTLKDVLYADTSRNRYLNVKDAYIEYFGQAQTKETGATLSTQYTTNPSESSLDTKITMGGEVANQLYWGVYTTFQLPIPLRVPAPLPPSALVHYNTNLTADLQGVRSQEQTYINFAAQAMVTIPANHGIKADLMMQKQTIIQNFNNVVILTGFIAIVTHDPIDGKDIWFQPIVNVTPFLPPTVFTVQGTDLIFKGLGVFQSSLNMYPYYHFTKFNTQNKVPVEEYDFYNVTIEADKPLLLAAL
ncbi:hypothetical protein [Paenibacillus zanthoxyli]|uniref:hypothetical protein n=1 Tax=Paenibacillus zanthoxyli TaxID=369399 RepID=UPI0004715539|nr:hypothetical protein [Paenibacillus zanthoxyli]